MLEPSESFLTTGGFNLHVLLNSSKSIFSGHLVQAVAEFWHYTQLASQARHFYRIESE